MLSSIFAEEAARSKSRRSMNVSKRGFAPLGQGQTAVTIQ